MNNNTFNAVELEALKNRAEETFSKILEELSRIEEYCDRVSDLVMSEDSSLGVHWSAVSSTVKKVYISLNTGFDYVRRRLLDYINMTIQNEQLALAELKKIDDSLDALGNVANSLADGLSQLATNTLNSGVSPHTNE